VSRVVPDTCGHSMLQRAVEDGKLKERGRERLSRKGSIGQGVSVFEAGTQHRGGGNILDKFSSWVGWQRGGRAAMLGQGGAWVQCGDLGP
jgi:hypothetical protein